jgi:hypothetical protein
MIALPFETFEEQTSVKEKIKITQPRKHRKKCLPSLAVKEMQIKMTPRLYLTTVRMATIKNTNDNKCWPGCGEKELLIYFLLECKLEQSLWKTL